MKNAKIKKQKQKDNNNNNNNNKNSRWQILLAKNIAYAFQLHQEEDFLRNFSKVAYRVTEYIPKENSNIFLL